MTVLRKTTALCRDCGISHSAEVIVRDNQVIGVVHCPVGVQEHLISSKADMYLALTAKSQMNPSDPPAEDQKYTLNYISITNACNFHCSVCAVNSGGDNHTFISVDEVVKRAEESKKKGAKIIRLFGGEPTIHPELCPMIERLTRMGLKVWILSNGFLLGTKKDIVNKLKAFGLKGVCLQFDSFKEATLDYYCRDYLKEKSAAIEHLIEADISVGFNCTVSRRNISELGQLLKKEIAFGANVKNLVFGSAAPVGRFHIDPDESVDREEIISSFIKDPEQTYFSFDDVFALPTFLPWGAQIHPDCGAHVVLIRTPQGVKALNQLIDVKKLYDLMADCRMRSSVLSTKIVPAYYILKSIRKGKLGACLKIMAGLVLSAKTYSLFNVAFTDYRAKSFLDEQRLSRCSAMFYTSVGAVSGCLHFYQGDDKPGSLAYEAAHGSC